MYSAYGAAPTIMPAIDIRPAAPIEVRGGVGGAGALPLPVQMEQPVNPQYRRYILRDEPIQLPDGVSLWIYDLHNFDG